MIKTVEQTTVADIFSINTSKVYRIPKYQREYTWGKNDWDALFGDVMENGSGYFLGSYICVNNSSLSETVLEVIDGQQRFSTLTLLLAALYEKLDSYSDDMDEEDKNDGTGIAFDKLDVTRRYGDGKCYTFIVNMTAEQQNI